MHTLSPRQLPACFLVSIMVIIRHVIPETVGLALARRKCVLDSGEGRVASSTGIDKDVPPLP